MKRDANILPIFPPCERKAGRRTKTLGIAIRVPSVSCRRRPDIVFRSVVTKRTAELCTTITRVLESFPRMIVIINIIRSPITPSEK